MPMSAALRRRRPPGRTSRKDLTRYGCAVEKKKKTKQNASRYRFHVIFLAHRWRFVFHCHHFTPPPNSPGSPHRHCGVSDRVARRLPDLRRGPRLQQVLGESAARLGCHLLIRALAAHPSTCSLLRCHSGLGPGTALLIRSHARAHAHSIYAAAHAHGGADCQNGPKLPVVTVSN